MFIRSAVGLGFEDLKRWERRGEIVSFGFPWVVILAGAVLSRVVKKKGWSPFSYLFSTPQCRSRARHETGRPCLCRLSQIVQKHTLHQRIRKWSNLLLLKHFIDSPPTRALEHYIRGYTLGHPDFIHTITTGHKWHSLCHKPLVATVPDLVFIRG